jgi:hypothetical protein
MARSEGSGETDVEGIRQESARKSHSSRPSFGHSCDCFAPVNGRSTTDDVRRVVCHRGHLRRIAFLCSANDRFEVTSMPGVDPVQCHEPDLRWSRLRLKTVIATELRQTSPASHSAHDASRFAHSKRPRAIGGAAASGVNAGSAKLPNSNRRAFPLERVATLKRRVSCELTKQ